MQDQQTLASFQRDDCKLAHRAPMHPLTAQQMIEHIAHTNPHPETNKALAEAAAVHCTGNDFASAAFIIATMANKISAADFAAIVQSINGE